MSFQKWEGEAFAELERHERVLFIAAQQELRPPEFAVRPVECAEVVSDAVFEQTTPSPRPSPARGEGVFEDRL